jgi:hypothetical protein
LDLSIRKLNTLLNFSLDNTNAMLSYMPMRLSDYINRHSSIGEFAEAVGVTTAGVRLWVAGQRVPTRDKMNKIIEVTRGKVKPNDFYEAA